MAAFIAAINNQKYINLLLYGYYAKKFKTNPILNSEQIMGFEEPYRKLLYSYYGYIAQLDNYTIEELNEKLYDLNDDYYDTYYKNVYIFAVLSNNLKTIKYLHSRNINYDDYINLYYIAIKLGYLNLIKYYDSNNIIFKRKTNSYLEKSPNCGSLKMIKYFELKAKDAPNFELQIIMCYINAVSYYKPTINILKYLESKYPLYITNDIINIAKRDALDNERFKKFKYLNRNNKYLNTSEPLSILIGAYNELYVCNKIEAIHIIKYIFSHVNELIIKRIEYTEIYNMEYLKPIFKQVGNYFIRYRAKYSLFYL